MFLERICLAHGKSKSRVLVNTLIKILISTTTGKVLNCCVSCYFPRKTLPQGFIIIIRSVNYLLTFLFHGAKFFFRS